MDELLDRLRGFHDQAFPDYQEQFEELVRKGQHPSTLFIGCSDSRVVPHLLTGAGPGELFVMRNVGAFVPPFEDGHGHHCTAAAIEFAITSLHVHNIVVCGHSHCGAVRTLYGEVPKEAVHLRAWLDLGREAKLPVAQPDESTLRRTEQRSVVLQLERLMGYPIVRRHVDDESITLHGWHYVIEEGEVHTLDIETGVFTPAASAQHS